ncbi:hypothetical protein ACFFRR_010434 [Megaselia abdita]
MDNNEFARLPNFIDSERDKSNNREMTASSSSTLNSVNYSVKSLTEVFNSYYLHDSKKPPTPPPRLKKQMRQDKSEVFQIASRFENIQFQYQNGCKLNLGDSFQEEEGDINLPTPPVEDNEVVDSVSLNTPLPEEGKNVSTVFRFKDAYNFLARPRTDGKNAPRAPIKYNSYHPEEVTKEAAKETSSESNAEDIQYRSKELIPKEVKPIIDELIKTEETYVENLRIGLKNYEQIFKRGDLPAGLCGKKFVLMGNVEQLLEFHEMQFLPMLRKERHDITRLFNEFVRFLDEHYFYSYVIYTMNKKRSLQLCDIYKVYFNQIQDELGDKLGIMSFLVQPIQRLARYHLLLNKFNAKLFEVSSLPFKSVLAASGKVEKRLKDLCLITNESEQINDIVNSKDFNVFYQGHFKKLNDFHCVDYTKRKGYQSRLFLFDKCVIYTEIANDKRLIFRGCYPCEHIGVIPKANSLTLFYEKQKLQECVFKAEYDVIQNWVDLIQEMMKGYAKEEKRQNLAQFRNNNRFISDSWIGDMWQAPRAIQD